MSSLFRRSLSRLAVGHPPRSRGRVTLPVRRPGQLAKRLVSSRRTCSAGRDRLYALGPTSYRGSTGSRTLEAVSLVGRTGQGSPPESSVGWNRIPSVVSQGANAYVMALACPSVSVL